MNLNPLKFVSRVSNESPVAGLAVAVVMIATAAVVLSALLPGTPAAALGVWYAMRKHQLPLRHFLRSRGAWLTALMLLAGTTVFWALEYALAGARTQAIELGGLSLILSYVIHFVIEGKLMKSILELVPAGQRADLHTFIAGEDPAIAAGGAVADLSHFDPIGVADAIKSRVIGQDAAVEASTSLIFRRARLRRPKKPIATLLFVGATGAGKTELAKALADELFRRNLVRVDCAELSQAHSTQRLIGAPPGYIGSEAGGWLCREIGRVKTGILLFDEIEKAHPDVMTLIMALLDEARLTEQSTGTTYNATGFVIVLTSNAAASQIAQVVAATGDGPERVGRVKDELKTAGFRTEVLARVDLVQPFGELSRAAVAEIVGLFLQGFAADVGIDIRSVDAALLIDLIGKREKVQGYGVREVVRLVEGAVVDGLLDVKERGYSAASITIVDDRVIVSGVE